MYHAHVYFSHHQQQLAEDVRQKLLQSDFTEMKTYPLVTKNVGPHTKPMLEINFKNNDEGFIEWLDQHRNGLSVLIHPLTGNEIADHSTEALWLGEKLDLNFAVLGCTN